MIPVTEEMLAAFREAVRQGGDTTDEIRAAGIAAVLAIVERDYQVCRGGDPPATPLPFVLPLTSDVPSFGEAAP